MIKYVVILIVAVLAILGGRFLLVRNGQPIAEIGKVMKWDEPPSMEIDADKKYLAELDTSAGKMTIELFAKEAPITVNNFVFLARRGFYDGTKFHRVIRGFMIQGGDPNCDPSTGLTSSLRASSGPCGTGGPGYRFDDEKIIRDYDRGIVAMANAGPNTNGSQFFIMHQDYPLPKQYVIFGWLTDGFEILDKIAATPVVANASGEPSSPVKSVLIKKIAIVED